MSSAEIGETVRELENLVRQIVVLNTGGAIGRTELPFAPAGDLNGGEQIDGLKHGFPVVLRQR